MRMNDLSTEELDLISAQAKARAAETMAAPVSNDGLLETPRLIRARHADPTDAYYAGHPDRVAASELQLKAIMLRAGVNEVPDTVLSVAQKQHEAQWTQTELPPLVAATIQTQLAA